MLTRNSFDKMDEAALRNDVLIPLLRVLGHQDVYEYHGGAGEQGKDIICWKLDDLGCRVNLAVVAKATQMTGQAKNARGAAGEVQTQIRQCFGCGYKDPVTAEQEQVHHVWVMSNKKITKEAEVAIASAVANQDMMRNVRFIDGDKLWGLVEKHLPVSIMHYVSELKKAAQTSDSHYEPHIVVSGEQATVTLCEKYPGAAEEKPIHIKTNFVSEEAATEFQQRLLHYQETGEPTEIPSELIKGIDLPDFVRNIFGIRLDQVKLSLVPPPIQREFPVHINVLCDDGDEYSRNYVVLRGERVGTKEAIVASEERDVPFRLTLHFKSRNEDNAYVEADFNIKTREGRYNAVQWWEWLHLCTCLNKPCRIQVDSVENGFRFFEARPHLGMIEAPPQQVVEFYRRLASVQQITKTPIFIPDRILTPEEMDAVEETYEAVTAGRLEGVWDRFAATLDPVPETIENWLTNFPRRQQGIFVVEREERVTLFDAVVPLGRVRYTLHNAVLENAEELRRRYEEIKNCHESVHPEHEPVEIVLRPDGEANQYRSTLIGCLPI